MTQEDKELLLKDLCARLPYGVILDFSFIEGKQRIHTKRPLTYRNIGTVALDEWHSNEEIFKPYLRPLSSMTEEEKKYISDKCGFSISRPIGNECGLIMPVLAADWLINFYNEHHIDYRGLIEKGLALVALEGMYETKKTKN